MIWLALLFVGCGLLDLVRRPTAPRALAEGVAAGTVVVLALLAGVTHIGGLAGVLVVIAAVVGWSRSVAAADAGRAAALPLAVLGGAVALALVLSGTAGPVSGPLAAWWEGLDWSFAAGTDPTRALLVLGVVLVQISTANVVVRLVLASTGTLRPAEGAAADPAGASAPSPVPALRGGRLLGPMERLLIVGLGLAGNLTAASIVVAAKGLLRFPELSSRREQEHVHALTEYFLVGSFVSWVLALGSLVLLR